MAGMVIVVLCTNPNTRARGSRNSTKCEVYRTKIGSLKETTKRILRWLNHDHMLPPLHASSQFTIYYFGHACGLWNCGLLSNAPVVRKHMDKDSTLEIWQYQPEPNNQSTWGILMKNRNVEIYEPLIKGKPKKVAEILSWIKFGWQHYIPHLLEQQLLYLLHVTTE